MKDNEKIDITLVLEDVRSAYNVGSLLRSADGFGCSEVITIGITPHFKQKVEDRLPHVVAGAEKQIAKTALDAQRLLGAHFADSKNAIEHLRKNGFEVLCIEQSADSKNLASFTPKRNKVALVLGNEIDGVSDSFLNAADATLEIAMHGEKESLNVSVSGAVALYHLSQVSATL